MTLLNQGLQALSDAQLRGMRRGIEKESLRVLHGGELATTSHPPALGAALTHPSITTDFSEAQLELVTGAHPDVRLAIEQLTEIHQFVYRTLAAADEQLWVSSMPCRLPPDDSIPIGRYGHSNVGQAKSVYRTGLGHRYGRRMQTISGIHYNWSLPGVSDDDYFALIRNFRRRSFLLLYLFGASPAVCPDFVRDQPHGLEPLGDHTLYLPHATSLRMGRLGYQSEAQASLAVSYNSLAGYGSSLHDALTRSYPPYEAIGIQGPDGTYRQLATSLLQIENEFYGTIRPKRVIFPGERPLHALRERGVEYVEVRCMDLDPFEPVGISARTARFLDMFLLHCLLTDSPPDTPEEIAALGRNQQLTATRGREPGLVLERGERTQTLVEWADELLREFHPIAALLDRFDGGSAYREALDSAWEGVRDPSRLPSARVVAAIRNDPQGSHSLFTDRQSASTRAALLDMPWSSAQQARYEALTNTSVADQRQIEGMDSMPFEIYRREYLAPHRLEAAPR